MLREIMVLGCVVMGACLLAVRQRAPLAPRARAVCWGSLIVVVCVSGFIAAAPIAVIDGAMGFIAAAPSAAPSAVVSIATAVDTIMVWLREIVLLGCMVMGACLLWCLLVCQLAPLAPRTRAVCWWCLVVVVCVLGFIAAAPIAVIGGCVLVASALGAIMAWFGTLDRDALILLARGALDDHQ